MNGSQHKQGRPKSRQSIAHVSSQSNTTTDIAALKRSIDAQERSKKPRGKSLGPGGLEALTETNANAFRIPPAHQPRSILKTSIPITPPKNIPSFDELRQKGNTKAKSPAKSVSEDLLIDFSTPAPTHEAGTVGSVAVHSEILDPFSPVRSRDSSTEHLRNSNREMSGKDLNNEEQKRQAEKERRAARRKSLANRRVSFAPEATLHTWSVMELMEDSTTSSAANSTRRQSAITAAQSPAPQVATPGEVLNNERPSTPVDQPLDSTVDESSVSQRELHQRKRRRTSDCAHSSDDETFSSAGDDAESSPVQVEDSIDSESDTDGDTAMSLDEATANSIRSSDSSGTQTSLDERLRQAADQAGTRGIEYDENGSENDGDLSMEIADGTVTHAFKQYARKEKGGCDSTAAADKENIHPFHSNADVTNGDHELRENDPTSGITMEMTSAVGSIISNTTVNKTINPPAQFNNGVSGRMPLNGENSIDDETMDLTVAKGYILEHDDDEEDDDYENEKADELSSDEEITMEMTNILGGINNDPKHNLLRLQGADQTEAMDMTIAAGGILPPIEEQTEPQTDLEEDMTGAMEMTRAVGQILGNTLKTSASMSADKTQKLGSTPDFPPSHGLAQNLPSSSTTTRQMTTIASETGSPTLQPRMSACRITLEKHTTTPRSTPRTVRISQNGQTTPSKQLTPAPTKSVSPKRTPTLTGVTHRGASPKKLFTKEIHNRVSPATKKSPQKPRDSLFLKDQATGLHTPRVVLHAPKPHQHLHGRHRGVEDNDEKSGSPHISKLLSRRSSIGDLVPDFKLTFDRDRTLRIEDPQEIERQVDFERADEHRRESGRFIMEQEANEQEVENTTQNLKGMIESMTPKKENAKKYKGRKSLAIGSAKGLLGKRPAELDLDDENGEGDLTPKRLKIVSRETSPVKKVHLPKPPTKEETTGRLTNSEVLRLSTLASRVGTPVLNQSTTEKTRSPERTGYFRQLSSEKASSFENRLDNVIDATDIATIHPDLLDSNGADEKISLQQFLNMTNIHFIELSTTKRRHTKAIPSTDTETDDIKRDSTCATFVASTTTLPLLDLYQHATRELKSYISSGRQIIRTIEDETFKEQPPIFKRYLDADTEAKVFMDNQFRNGKTNARLQSKESWYSWRRQLVDGLQSGLRQILDDVKHDDQILIEQQRALDCIIPQLATQKAQLKQKLQDLRQRANQFENLDHGVLKVKRKQLMAANQELAQSVTTVKQLQEQMQEKDEVLSQAAELRQEMNDQIKEVVRVQEKQKRWPSKDVASVKQRVDKLEQEYGWKLLTSEKSTDDSNELGTALTLRYDKELILFFHPSAYRPEGKPARRRSGRNSRSVSGPSAPISLTCSPAEDDDRTHTPLSTELRFFLQLLQSQLQVYAMLPKNSINCQQVLKTISEGWSLASKITDEIRQLNTIGIVRVHIQNEQLVCSLMLMHPDRSRADISFTLTVQSLNNGEFSASTSVAATPVYGSTITVMDASKIRKVHHALTKEVGSRKLGEGSWIAAVQGFNEWLQAQKSSKNESLLPKSTGYKNTELGTTTISKAAAETNRDTVLNSQRAATQSPRKADNTISTTPKVPPRSPLAPRTTNRILKKTIPVPKKPVNFSQSQNAALELNATKPREEFLQKENVIPSTTETKFVQDTIPQADGDDVFGTMKPAITPAEQEAMMHTPVKKRIGALRRSPM